jgi:hypothetical protein
MAAGEGGIQKGDGASEPAAQGGVVELRRERS